MVTAAAEVDHIIPLARGGTNDLANLQPLCKSCHSRKTMRESVSGKLATAAGAEAHTAGGGEGYQILGPSDPIPSPAASRTSPRNRDRGVLGNAEETDADGD